MADPVVSALASGSSSVASTAVSFAAQPAGTLLLLTMAGDDYPSATPPTGWTAVQTIGTGSGSFHGNAMWFKVATGAETSVTYVIGSASRSAYKLSAITGLDTTAPLDVSAKSNTNGSANTFTTAVITPTAGARFIAVSVDGSAGGALLPAGTATAPYVTQGAGLSTTTPGMTTTQATLAFAGTGAATTSATVTWATTPEARSGIIASFKVATSGGTTTVGTTYASTWATRQRVNDPAPVSWAVRAPVLAGSGSAWAVRVAVIDPAPISWAVRTSVAARTAASAWAVRTGVSTSRASAWNVAAPRPYFPLADWLWSAIPASPVLDASSATWAGYLAAGQHVADLREFGVNLQQANGTTPRYTVPLSMAATYGYDPLSGKTVPIPSGTTMAGTLAPGSGGDAHLSVADSSTNRVWSLWQAINTATGPDAWGASYAGIALLDGDGREFDGSSTGGSLSRYAGVIRAADLTAAVAANSALPYAIFCSSSVSATTFRYPASKADASANIDGVATPIPLGTRLQLDPTINVDALSGITAAEKVIAKTLQTRGAYVGDKGSARLAFLFELQPGTSPGTAYSSAGLTFDYFDMTHIPWGSLRALAQSDGGSPSTTTVSKTSASTWAARVSAGTASGSTWAARQGVATTRLSSWTVRQSTTLTAGSTWAVRARASTLAASAWSVRAAVLSSTGSAWAVRGSALASSGSAWATRAAVLSASSSAWAVRVSALTSRASTWSARQQVGASAGIIWNTSQTGLQAATPVAWAVRSSVTSTALLTWAARTSTARAASATWSTRAGTTASAPSTWATRSAAVVSSSAQTWATRSSTGTTRPLAWAARTSAGSTSEQAWAVRTSAVVVATSAQVWATRQTASRASAQGWGVFTPVQTSAGSQWAVRARVVASRASSWNVAPPNVKAAGSFPLSWRTESNLDLGVPVLHPTLAVRANLAGLGVLEHPGGVLLVQASAGTLLIDN